MQKKTIFLVNQDLQQTFRTQTEQWHALKNVDECDIQK